MTANELIAHLALVPGDTPVCVHEADCVGDVCDITEVETREMNRGRPPIWEGKDYGAFPRNDLKKVVVLS